MSKKYRGFIEADENLALKCPVDGSRVSIGYCKRRCENCVLSNDLGVACNVQMQIDSTNVEDVKRYLGLGGLK